MNPEMEDSNDKITSFSVSTYKTNNETYSMLKLQPQDGIMNADFSPKIRKDINAYFCEKKYKGSGTTKHVLDMSDVNYMDQDGLESILLINRMSRYLKYDKISLINCKDDIKIKLEEKHLYEYVNIKKDVSELI